jgi:hypothetical protein
MKSRNEFVFEPGFPPGFFFEGPSLSRASGSTLFVTPAKAGVHEIYSSPWIPASAGMTDELN